LVHQAAFTRRILSQNLETVLAIDCKSKLPLLYSDISHCSAVGYPGLAWARKNNKKKREREIGLRCFTVLFFFFVFLSCTA